MEGVMTFVREFGNLINTALILALVGIALKVLQGIIAQKDAQLAVLRERTDAAEAFSVSNVVEKFRALREWYEEHLRTWYETSITRLQEEKMKAVEAKQEELQLRIEEEIAKRTDLMATYAEMPGGALGTTPQVSSGQVCGSYMVVGHNPQRSTGSYFGELRIGPFGEALCATWEIGGTKQCWYGIGLLLGNRLAFVFRHTDPQGHLLHGVILYEIVTEDIMRGHWTGFGTSFVGFEECRKIRPASCGHRPGVEECDNG
jgi:hypothetical protein